MFLGIQGSFWRAKGLEIRKNPRLLSLQKGLVELSGGTIVQEIVSYVVLSTGEKLIGGIDGSDGKIWYQASGASTWSLVYTHTGAGSILGMGEFNDYFYWTTGNSLHRTALSDVATFSAPTTGYKTLSATNTDHKPMIEAYNNLYIGVGNVLDELDSAGTLTQGKLTLAGDDVVRNINFSGTTIRIYTRKDSNDVDEGAIYFWDGIESWKQRTKLDGIFHCSTTMENVDYFLAGLEPWLYRLDGLTATKVKKIPQRDSTFTNTVPVLTEINPIAMTNLAGIIYFGTGDNLTIGGIGANYIEKGIWSYGRLQEGYPYSLTLEWAASDYDDDFDEVSALFASQGQLNIIGKSTTPSYHAYQIDFDAYQTDGEIELRVFDANVAWRVKEALRLIIAMYPLAAGEKIEVFVKRNLESSYSSALLTAQYSDSADQDVCYKLLTDAFADQDFNYMQFKIKLTAGTSQLTTPTLTDFAMVFDEVPDS